MASSTKKRKYGLILDRPKGQDYVFGVSSLPMDKIQPDGDWTPYLPQKEYQNLNGIEPYACVAFTILNCVEILIKKQYGEDRNYSDRFLAAISGTKEIKGNSPQTVAEFLRKVGVVSQDLWPFDDSIKTFNDFYAPIPPKLYQLAKEFNDEWDFKHEYVIDDPIAITEALKCSPLAITVPAWHRRNGQYYRPKGVIDNHMTTLFVIREGSERVFDSYDREIKDLVPGMTHAMIKRFYIKKKTAQEKITFLTKMKELLEKIISLFQQIETMKEEEKVEEKLPGTILYETAKKFLGKEGSPADKAPDDLACAETVNHIYKEAFGEEIGGDVSTYRLYSVLRNHEKFQMTNKPEPGDIIISPTGYGNGRIKNGHAGIVMEEGKIASNNSKTGLFEENYTLASWDARYVKQGGFPVHIFRRT